MDLRIASRWPREVMPRSMREEGVRRARTSPVMP